MRRLYNSVILAGTSSLLTIIARIAALIQRNKAN